MHYSHASAASRARRWSSSSSCWSALVGMAALVIDGGSWYRAQRQLQTAADAGALAGVQELPLDQIDAPRRRAQATRSRTTPAPGARRVIRRSRAPTRSTSSAKATRPGILPPGLRRGLQRRGRAGARPGRRVHAEKLKKVAPIGIHKDYACIVTDPSCFGQTLTLDFAEDDDFDPTKSKFGLLDLDRDQRRGRRRHEEMARGRLPGCPSHRHRCIPPRTGEKNGIKKELEDAADASDASFCSRSSTTPSTTATATTSSAGLHSSSTRSSSGPATSGNHVIKGHFVTFIASDLAAGNPITDPDNDFGVNVITLTK